MGVYTFVNGFLSVGGVDLSDKVKSMTLNTGVETQDPSAMGVNTRLAIAGLGTWSVAVTFNQDFAAGEVDATLAPLVGPNLTAALVIRPDAGAKSATNPEYTGTAVISSYQPIGGSVGDLAVAPVTFVAASDLTRDAS